MQKQRIGLLSIRTVPELVEGKSPMVVIFCQCYEGKYKYYRMRKTIGHGYYKTHNKFVPILTDGLEASRLEFRQMPFPKFDDTKYQDGI